MQGLQTFANTTEIARVTGLTFDEVLYRGQMVRTWSMLLRCAQDEGYVVGAAHQPANLESMLVCWSHCRAVALIRFARAGGTYLIHPIENRTAGPQSVYSVDMCSYSHTVCFSGLYTDPIAVLDFASLYPSIFMAYNLCYSTLVHPDDLASVPADEVIRSPTGAVFVKPTLRQGLVPNVLRGLVNARASVKASMRVAKQQEPDGANSAKVSVLDARQLALKVSPPEICYGGACYGDSAAGWYAPVCLKVCANALYGFIGSPASPLCCGPLAEACIFTGSQLCHRARGIIETEAAIDLAAGIPGMPKVPKVARVIYGQTDSLMVLFPSATPAQAVEAGEYLAGEVRRPCAMWCSPRRPQLCLLCRSHGSLECRPCGWRSSVCFNLSCSLK